MSRPSNFNRIHADQAVAVCTREQAVQLVDYDHHTISVNGRTGVMLTYEWLPLEQHTGPFVLTVVFHHARYGCHAPRVPASHARSPHPRQFGKTQFGAKVPVELVASIGGISPILTGNLLTQDQSAF